MTQGISKSKWHLLAVFALAYAVFFAGLARAPVPTVDGAVRAAEARTIVETGRWFPVFYHGEAANDHPPLFVWAIAKSFQVFGVNDFAANLPARFCAFMTLVFTALIALEVGFAPGLALLSALVLATTRDFVLSCVRGYIEPMLEFFIYGGLWLVFRQRRRRSYAAASGAALCVFGAFFSKGPPALWPMIAFAFLLVWLGGLPGARLRVFSVYALTLAACFGLFFWWISSAGLWADWDMYLRKQVLSSALDGRGGAQSSEPFYFAEILLGFYWPWLPFLLLGAWRSLRWLIKFELTDEAIYSWVFGLFGLGFIAGFSAVKWKFWYYISPAYPALALFIASTLHSFVKRWTRSPAFGQGVFAISSVWILAAAAAPLSLHRERVPEVQAFKSAIARSGVDGPVYFYQAPGDHNMVGTSGEWYFNRRVLKITEEKTLEEELSRRKSAWVLTSADLLRECGKGWCEGLVLVQSSGCSALALKRQAVAKGVQPRSF